MKDMNFAEEWSGEKIQESFAEEEALQHRKRWAEITSGNCGNKKCYSKLRDNKDLVVWKNLCVYGAGNGLVWAELKPRRTLWGAWAQKSFCAPTLPTTPPPISCRQDSSFHGLPWVPKGGFEQLLVKGRAAKKLPEAGFRDQRSLRLGGTPPETLHRVLSATLPLNCCYKTLLGWDTQFSKAEVCCVPLCLEK